MKCGGPVTRPQLCAGRQHIRRRRAANAQQARKNLGNSRTRHSLGWPSTSGRHQPRRSSVVAEGNRLDKWALRPCLGSRATPHRRGLAAANALVTSKPSCSSWLHAIQPLAPQAWPCKRVAKVVLTSTVCTWTCLGTDPRRAASHDQRSAPLTSRRPSRRPEHVGAVHTSWSCCARLLVELSRMQAHHVSAAGAPMPGGSGEPPWGRGLACRSSAPPSGKVTDLMRRRCPPALPTQMRARAVTARCCMRCPAGGADEAFAALQAADSKMRECVVCSRGSPVEGAGGAARALRRRRCARSGLWEPPNARRPSAARAARARRLR